MNKIQIDSIGFKNFMCYGSSWQDIKLKNGVNFVTGINKDRNKNNGAGKSAFLEVIPYTLFGKIARNIKQDQIINWKNKSAMETVIRFYLNDNYYEVFRGLKPNKFEIYKNSKLVNKDAHVSDYQAMFEDIFGMDIKLFMNLIHSNVNNSGSILSMKKAEKRAFLEKMFGLEIYSNMNKLANEKLRNLDDKKFKADVRIDTCNSNIENSEKLKDKFKYEIQSKKGSIENIDEIKEKLNEIKEDNPNIDADTEKIEKSIEDEKSKINNLNKEYEKNIAVLNTKLESINKDILVIENQEEQRNKNEVIKTKIKDIIDEKGDFDTITKKIKKLQLEKDDIKEVLKKSNDDGLFIHKELSTLQSDLKNIQKNLKLLADGKCPTCGQNVDNPIKGYKNEEDILKNKINNKENEISIINIKSSELQEKDDKLINEINILLKFKDEIVKLQRQIKEVGSNEDKEELIKSKKLILDNIKKLEKEYNNENNDLNSKIKSLKNRHNDLMEIKGNIFKIQKDYDIAVSKAEEIKNTIESLQVMIKEQNENIDKLKKEKKEIKEEVVKLNNLSDYLNSIKFILKDENIKQFTIKQIMPFLNKQANHYLSEVNYGFYISIDKWLDVDIKGPGIRNATYESLSGGERRGIDLALQLALLDISRLMSNIFPDILIFDEILDSSIDSTGINQLIKIIKTKQHEFGGKIFIITHRSEIPQDFMDNEYRIEKSNGFSKVVI